MAIKYNVMTVTTDGGGNVATVDGHLPDFETGNVISDAPQVKEELLGGVSSDANTLKKLYDLMVLESEVNQKLDELKGGVGSEYDTLKKLQDKIIAINALLSSDDSALDSIQELVDYIKDNQSVLDSLSISSIIGLQNALDGKVDKIIGKGLSDNNLTDVLKNKILSNETNKVDKETGKTLSTNDFTDPLKSKLENSDALNQNKMRVGGSNNIQEEKTLEQVYDLLDIDNSVLTKMNEVLGNFQITVTSDIEAAKNELKGGAGSQYDTLKKLQDLIIAIQTALNSDDSTLDSIQELVDYIKNNKNTLDTLGISSILGLQTALDAKVDKVAGKGLSQNDLTNTLLSQFLLYETTKVDKVAGKELSDNNLTDDLKNTILSNDTNKVDKVAGKELSDNNLTDDLKTTIQTAAQENVIYDMNAVDSPAPNGLTGGSDIFVTFDSNVKYLKVVYWSGVAGAAGDQIVYEIHKTNNAYDSGIGYGHGVSEVPAGTYSLEHFSTEKTYSRSVAKWSDNTFTHSHTGFISYPDGTESSARQFSTAYVIKKIIEVK